jgi:16S rRNA (guanine966-N2)-methyltransferase
MPGTIRITSGTAKNKKLTAPEIEGFRSVQEVVKLAIFSIVGEGIENKRCLDLYSGSGNLGLEALSRGAGFCDFVDENWEAKQAILKNIKNCGFEEKAEVHLSDAVKYVANTSNIYYIIFVDPFYQNTHHRFLFKNLEEILEDKGLIFFLHGGNIDVEQILRGTNLISNKQRRFGKSHVDIVSKQL